MTIVYECVFDPFTDANYWNCSPSPLASASIVHVHLLSPLEPFGWYFLIRPLGGEEKPIVYVMDYLLISVQVWMSFWFFWPTHSHTHIDFYRYCVPACVWVNSISNLFNRSNRKQIYLFKSLFITHTLLCRLCRWCWCWVVGSLTTLLFCVPI